MLSPSALNVDIGRAREDEQEYSQVDYDHQEYYPTEFEQQVNSSNLANNWSKRLTSSSKLTLKKVLIKEEIRYRKFTRRSVYLRSLKIFTAKQWRVLRRRWKPWRSRWRIWLLKSRTSRASQGHRLPPRSKNKRVHKFYYKKGWKDRSTQSFIIWASGSSHRVERAKE